MDEGLSDNIMAKQLTTEQLTTEQLTTERLPIELLPIEQSPIEQSIMQQISGSATILVAYSGGIDSTVLLHALVKIKQRHCPDLKLQAMHIHHGISVHADEWANHCQQQCQQWSVPLTIQKVQLDLTNGNIEEQARRARYLALQQYMSKNPATLCTAQHLDDQSETFLLALKRGSGPTGLSAMPMRTNNAGYLHIRPLLSISRLQIEAYAALHHLTWVEDESNQDDHYDRNFLRLNIMPQLKQRWPHFDQMVARSAMLCQQQQALIDELLQPTLVQLVNDDGTLSLPPLLDVSEEKFNALMRMWLKMHNVLMPSLQQLQLIRQTVVLAREDSNPQFILHDKQIRRYQNRLYLLPQYLDLQAQILSWNIQQPLILPDNLGCLVANTCLDPTITTKQTCRLPTASEIVTVRFHGQGRLQLVGREGSRSIKKLWQEYEIPSWMRTRIPLIYYNESLIAAAGVFVTTQGDGQSVIFTMTTC